MKLTRRQEEFVHMMHTLKEEFQGPIRYHLLAERLGVSPFTAYDMLCLLEEKGYVTSAYQLPSEKSGPGRAERVFFPADKAIQHERQMRAVTGGTNLEGETLKELLLAKLGHGQELEGDQELLEQMLAYLPPAGRRDVRYCVEVMKIVALRLRNSPGQTALLEQLPDLLPGFTPSGRAPLSPESCHTNLCLLGGFVFGLLARHDEPGQEWLAQLRQHLQGYLDVVMEMSPEDCQVLAAQLVEVFVALEEVE